MADRGSDPHFPGRAEIEGYGAGGFRFAGMSHRGSILVLPAGIWAWEPGTAAEIDETSLQRVLKAREEIDFFLIGTGRDSLPLSAGASGLLREAGIRFDTMITSAATSTYNILLAERRRVAAALIATP